MPLLLRNESNPEEGDFLLFGSGAIGTAISRNLQGRRSFTRFPYAIPWHDPHNRVCALRRLFNYIHDPQITHNPNVTAVWAAGRAGFGATSDDTAAELAAYRDVLHLLTTVEESRSKKLNTFHLISSAGALYEGRTVRSPSEAPTPIRPYGDLKLTQETDAVNLFSFTRSQVYRPSSVYTAPGRGLRLGLIGTLVQNALAQRSTTITGALDTLRDYVLADDVGAYVAARLLANAEAHASPHMLVSAEPVSILQVIRLVESVVRRALYIRIADSWNARNITFLPATQDADFASTSLRVGIHMVHAASLGTPLSR